MEKSSRPGELIYGVPAAPQQFEKSKESVLEKATTIEAASPAASKILDEKNIPYENINIEQKGWSREDLFNFTGGRTVPQIVIKGKCIGGYDDLVLLESEGKL